MRYFYFFTLLLLGLSPGCQKVPPADDGFVSCVIEDRIGSEVTWQNQNVNSFIETSLKQELTPDVAIQIALLNNPNIQAFFEELGIAQANLVEAGLLTNPSYSLEIRNPNQHHLTTNIEYLITSSVLDLFLIPLKTKLAFTEFQQTKLTVANKILNLAFDVRETYFDLVAETEKIKYLEAIAELASIRNEIASRQFEIGNINSLDFLETKSSALIALVNLANARNQVIPLREKLNQLLGFCKNIPLILPEHLPENLEYSGFDLCALETTALTKRLELQVARFEVFRIAVMLRLKDPWTYTNFSAGLAGEKDPDGVNLIGPGFSGDIPIFNWGQGARARLISEFNAAKNKLKALEIQVVSEVREAHLNLMNTIAILNEYQDTLLPMQEELLSRSEAFYNVMNLGVDKLLENKEQQMHLKENYTDAAKHYLKTRVNLDRALGGNLQ